MVKVYALRGTQSLGESQLSYYPALTYTFFSYASFEACGCDALTSQSKYRYQGTVGLKPQTENQFLERHRLALPFYYR